MRKILLASCGILALTVGVAMADSHSDPGTTVAVSVPIKNATASGGSSAATTGGTAGSYNGNSLSATSSKSVSNSFNKSETESTSISKSFSLSKTENTNKNFSANSGGSGGSASATTGGVAINKPDSGNKAFAALGSTAVSDGNLSQVTTKNHLDLTMASASSSADVSGNNVTTGQMHEAKITGSNVTMTYSMGGTGILTAQQNSGAAASQQNSVALSSIVSASSGSPGGFYH